MHFGFVLEMLNTALWNIDLLDTHLDLFHTDIPRKYFDIFKACFQDISLRHLQDKSWRHLEDVFSVTTFCLLRGLQDVLQEVKLLLWRGVEEIFKACLEDFLETFSRPTNVCLVVFWYPDDLWNKLNLYLDMTQNIGNMKFNSAASIYTEFKPKSGNYLIKLIFE